MTINHNFMQHFKNIFRKSLKTEKVCYLREKVLTLLTNPSTLYLCLLRADVDRALSSAPLSPPIARSTEYINITNGINTHRHQLPAWRVIQRREKERFSLVSTTSHKTGVEFQKCSLIVHWSAMRPSHLWERDVAQR